MQSIINSIEQNLIEKDRWRFIIDGLRMTIIITVCALLLGIIIGVIVAVIRNTYDNTGKLKVLNFICNVYLTIIRGTPVVVQLLLIYFGIFNSVRIDKTLVAILAFAINSGAYQAEIFRAGIQSVPRGQFEAGRSLGFNYAQTMSIVIVPQAFKNVLPTLANEFIVLLKESSVAGYVALQDLTKAGDIIRGQTYSPFTPILIVALIYLVLVMGLSYLVSLLERSLKKNER